MEGENVGQMSSLPQSINVLPLSMQIRVLEASVRQLHRQLTDAVLRNSTDYQRLVDELVAVRCSDFSLKYQILNVKELFLQNSQTNEGIEMLVTALGILHKYANNLLKQELERPVRWREIYLLNPTFSHKVDVVQGTRDILERLGYKLVPPDKMAFPLGKEPDRELVARVTADILLGKADLQAFLRQQHPQQQQFAQFLRHRHLLSSPNIWTVSHGDDSTFLESICGSSSHWTEADLDNHLPISKIPRPGIESSPMSAPGTVSSPMSAPGIVPSTMSRSGTVPSTIARFCTVPLMSGPATMPPVSGPHTMMPMSGPRTMPPMSGPHTMTSMSGPKSMTSMSGPHTMMPKSGPRTMPPMSGPHTMKPMSGPRSMTPMSGLRTLPPMLGPDTFRMLHYSTSTDRHAANEQTKCLLMLKAQHRHINRQLNQTEIQLQKFNHQLCSLIKSNPDFMVNTNLESLKRDIGVVETQKVELEKQKAELELKMQMFMSSSIGAGIRVIFQHLSVTGGSLSPPDIPVDPPSQGSQSPSLLAHPPDMFIPVGPPSQGSQSPSLLAHPPGMFIPVGPPSQGSQSPSLLAHPPDMFIPVGPPSQGSQSPSLLAHPPDMFIPVGPPAQGSESPSLLAHPPDMPPGTAASYVSPNMHNSHTWLRSTDNSCNSVPCKDNLSDKSQEQCDLPSGNDMKTEEETEEGGAAPCCSTPSDVASGAGTLGVAASGAGTLGVVASGAGTLGGVASGGGILGGVVSGGGTLGGVANGAGTLDVIERGAGTLGGVASGGGILGGVASGGGTLGGVASGGGTLGGVASGGGTLGGVASGGGTLGGVASGGGTLGGVASGGGTLGGVASGGGTLGGVASGGGTLGGVASGGGTLGGVASGGGTLGGVASGGGTLGGVASGGGTLGGVASGGGTLGGVASGGGTLGGRPLMSCLADIHRQKEEEKKKQEALKKARVDVVDNEQSKIPEEGNIDSQVKSIKQSLSNTHGISDELSYQEVKEILYTCKGQFDLTIGQCHDARKAKLDLLQAAGVFNEAEALAALHQCKGNLEEAQKCIVDNIIEHSDWSKANFQQTLRDKAVDRRKKIRLLLTCGHLQCVEQADTFLQILDMDDLEGNITLADILESVKSCSNLSRSISYLQQECQLCLHHFSASQIHSLFLCQCKICIDCLTQYLELYVREKLIKEFVCPVCDEPDTENIDLAETHFEFLDMMIRTLMSPELYSLFEHKLTEWHLMRDPNFRWCSQPGCVSGFIGDPHELRMECPTCKQATCFQCKKPWADQHDGITCEEFQAWKEANDPEHQQAGLARHLEDNGIDCPHCNFRYSLAKGGCMHFKCIQCGHEFCSGCLRPFKRGSNCNVLQSCQRAGLHCHHPRDCLFYLRDRDVSDLQTLLNDNSVEYNTAAPSGSDCSPTCQVMEQKEMPNGLQDEPCQRPVPLYYAGLCETHYKEYLVSLINKNAIDPVVIMSTQELKRLLTNAGKSAPQKARRESGERYHKKLIEQVKQLLPLPTRRGGSSS